MALVVKRPHKGHSLRVQRKDIHQNDFSIKCLNEHEQASKPILTPQYLQNRKVLVLGVNSYKNELQETSTYTYISNSTMTSEMSIRPPRVDYQSKSHPPDLCLCIAGFTQVGLQCCIYPPLTSARPTSTQFILSSMVSPLISPAGPKDKQTALQIAF